MTVLTVMDLQQIKRDGQRIQAAICNERQMARIYDHRKAVAPDS